MKKIFLFFQTLSLSLVLTGCFFANIFDFGPEIDLNKNQWKIVSFSLDGILYEPRDFEETPSMRFDAKDLKLYGNTGCNSFFASYAWLDDKRLEMRGSGMTRKMCQSEELMKFEQKLMEEFDGEFEVIEKDQNLTFKKENLEIHLAPLDVGRVENTQETSNQKVNNQELQEKPAKEPIKQ